ncbi:hypothetical protein [Burkholderia ubonensis]|uniref:hypothetical protein n=1 Tax=Burkholderia ubonensis TaxID=101571 RepID=UPI000753E411|nr:hypothetical protein [Burkholderia ubonensis]AOI69141.1 hypothetical protein WI31_05875 [Burkholderia ubonensis]KUZ19524.1 hypothetical protein WI29_02645 [Burkholderia ubonensis]KUZ30317.1 hypothetical protein WI32_24460 [Burkholderia ubonensis]KUZ38436.1 hypothetical protein WI30_02875 [Burkholderia ubonensis]KUZ42953.1 hypothetical protein WI33_33500 [Burkholderia ubonensis]
MGVLGGGAKIDEKTGEVIAPTYEIGDGTFHNAGDALSNIDVVPSRCRRRGKFRSGMEARQQ